MERQVAVALHKTLGPGNVKLIYFDGHNGIVRCPHTAKDMTVALLNAMEEIDHSKVTVRTIGTSGTILKAKMKFIGQV